MRAFKGYLIRPKNGKPYFLILQYHLPDKPVQKRKGKKK